MNDRFYTKRETSRMDVHEMNCTNWECNYFKYFRSSNNFTKVTGYNWQVDLVIWMFTLHTLTGKPVKELNESCNVCNVRWPRLSDIIASEMWRSKKVRTDFNVFLHILLGSFPLFHSSIVADWKGNINCSARREASGLLCTWREASLLKCIQCCNSKI